MALPSDINESHYDELSSQSSSVAFAPDASPSREGARSRRKRKRADDQPQEIEVNIDAPEPPSKKALRKAKKQKLGAVNPGSKPRLEPGTIHFEDQKEAIVELPKRSEHGVWIGNLPWSANKAALLQFLTENSKITEESITRVHMPVPSEGTSTTFKKSSKPQNKGFAYVDFSSSAAVVEAVSLSETLFTGRPVLIKDSKSFVGRPEKSIESTNLDLKSAKSPNKRVFVGNLSFDTTKDDLQENFTSCGKITDIHVATFEDSGKCKGYAWVEFEDVVAGQAAVRGWVHLKGDQSGEEEVLEDSPGRKSTKPRKKPTSKKLWVNRIRGRQLRMEFAEDKAIRYKKRFGKEGAGNEDKPTSDAFDTSAHSPRDVATAPRRKDGTFEENMRPNNSKGARTNDHSKYVGRTDARAIKPGRALADAQRKTGAIVESKGKKTILT